MMTPAQLKGYEFKNAGRNAYKADDVDAFFGEVAVNYEKMFRENSELIKRVSLLADKLEQYKNDEVDIKQAVMSAQKAANMIIKEAEDAVADSKNEAEAILAAAKGEADIIKSDAEKQAIADADLIMSVAKDKAEEIIAKAKEKAHGILIAANDSASNTMGAANRTITSESLHYDMLKKEVSEFRASILAQYKAHIELISKLPEIAVEEASKIENEELPEKSVDEIEAYVDNDFQEVVEIQENEDVLEFVDVEDNEEVEEVGEVETDSDSIEEESGEPVIKTELPYDFFGEDSSLEFVEPEETEEPIPTVEEFQANCQQEFDEDVQDDNMSLTEPESDFADISISKKFSVDVNRIDYDSLLNNYSSENIDVEEENNTVEETVDDDTDYDDDTESSPPSFFDLIEKIDGDDDDEDDKPAKRRGFFRRK